MTERKAGWYWVVMEDSDEWTCMYHHPRHGWDPYSMETDNWGEPDVAKIGPRIPSPDEPWQCVPVEATRKMLDESWRQCGVSSPHVYRAMLAAAPSPGDNQ